MSAGTRRRKAVPAAKGAPESQLDHLVVIRESDRYDRVLMDGMVQQTLAKVAHLNGAFELQAAGVEVFDDPHRFGGSELRVGKSRIVMIERDGVLYLYSMGTAAKNDLDDTNAFVHQLVKIVETYRPREVWVVAFTRLLRSANYVGELLRAFSEHTQTLHCEAEMNVATPEGKMLFQVLAMIAATERDYIVRRHTAGRVAQWRRGEWIPNSYPPGYRLERRHLVLDRDAIEATRKMLMVLSDPALPPAACAVKIAALGISSPRLQRFHGADATLADARNPSEAIETLWGWIDVYETGRYDLLWPNPFPGVTAVSGVNVENHEGYPYGALRLPTNVEVPDGGWADGATFAAIGARRAKRTVTGGASHREVPPLAGFFCFSDTEHDFAMLGRERGTYCFLRRVRDPERSLTGWQETRTVETIGLARRSELHASIAESVRAAVAAGLPAALDAGRFRATGPLPALDPQRARCRAIRGQLDETARALRSARRNADLAGDDDAAALFVEDVKRHHAKVRQLELELAELEAKISEPTLDVTFESHAELVARGIAALLHAGVREPAALRDALRATISAERFACSDTFVEWELFIDLPHESGTVRLGPIQGRVENRARGRTVTPQGTVVRKIRRAIGNELIGLGLAPKPAASAAACPHDELALVLRSHLRGDPVPEGIDGAFAEMVCSVYTSPAFSWNASSWRLTDSVRRNVLGVLKEAGGSLHLRALLESGVTQSHLHYLSRAIDSPSGEAIIRSAGRGHDGRYALLPCPHCGGYSSHSIVTPETRPGVLCPTCWRTPRADSPVYPEWYRT